VVLASLFTQRKVRHDIAMTGEVTLTGKVLGIGGLKEKILAAKRAGIRNLIIPRENEETLSEISADILEDMNIMFVDKIKDVFSLVFLPETEPKKKTGKTASPSGDKA
jgi:ATP-dependent Lon protease